MEQSTLILLLLLLSTTRSTYTPESLDYVLRCIEYEASIESGTLTLVLYDIDPQYPFDNILDAVLQSSRLSHVVKYVVNGSYHSGLRKLPRNPSMLLIHPGNNLTHLSRTETINDVSTVLELFNPTAKALVFVDFFNSDVFRVVFWPVFQVGFVSMVFFDGVLMDAFLYNRVGGIRLFGVPPPMYLFTWIRREMSGKNITFYGEAIPLSDWEFTVRWVKEAARYLKTEACQVETFCEELTGKTLMKCLDEHGDEISNIDIQIVSMKMRPDTSREFAGLATSVPLMLKIAIPKERPLNVAEIILMPFDWTVWLLLVVILVLAEGIKQLFPDLFQNDPTLFVVCGFERYNLHEAGSLEKMILLSMVVLMFFASNAFETKMVSMMVSKPAIQRIKTLNDLLESDIKFYDDLEAHPYIANQTSIGKMVVQGSINVYDTIPGVGLLIAKDDADILELTAYDYERMQPWYVLLDFEYQIGFEFYQTMWRYQNSEVFRYVFELLVQAGIMGQWKYELRYGMRARGVGRRQIAHIESKVDLNFDDILPAWVVLGIGLGASLVTFWGELFRKWFESRILKREIVM